MGTSLNGIFGNGVMGMMAFSEAMGVVSDNIANQNTVGYKRVETQFRTLLPRSDGQFTVYGSNQDTGTRNTSGVQTMTRQSVSLQGQILQTGRQFDLAINGGGMFVFASGNITGGTLTPSDFFYSRAGDLKAFVPPIDPGGVDALITAGADSYLANKNGQFLMAVPLTGTALTAPPSSLSGLVPVQISSQGGSFFTTTTSCDLSAVIPAPGGAMGASLTSPLLNVAPLDDLTVLVPPPVTTGDTFDIVVDVNGTPTTYSFTIAGGESLDSLATAINTAGNPNVYASVTGAATNATLTLASPFDMTISDTLGSSAQGLFDLTGSSTTLQAATTSPISTPIFYFDTVGTRQGVTLSFSDPVTVQGTGTIWNVSAVDSSGVDIGTPPLGQVTFDGNGRLTAGSPLSIPALATFDIDLSNVAMLGTATSGDQALQVSFTANGLELGTFIGLDIARDGLITGRYSNGGTVPLYQIPIAVFQESNGLLAVNGNMYQPTTGDSLSGNPIGSGDPAFRFLGDDFASLEVGSIEASNVDLTDSFTQMIVYQRAYSSAATVVRTADEMSVVVRDLMR